MAGAKKLDFKWSRTIYRLPDIIMNTSAKCSLPLVIRIEEVGSPHVMDILFESEIYRLDSLNSQKRAILEAQEGSAYSIPQNYPIYFKRQVRGRSSKESLSLLELAKEPRPVDLEFDVRQSDRKDFTKYKFCKLKLVQDINITYAIANQLNDQGCICSEVISLSSMWEVKVRISRAIDMQLCRGCQDYLGKYMRKKKDIVEPDFYIDDLKTKQQVNDYEKNFTLVPSDCPKMPAPTVPSRNPDPPVRPQIPEPSLPRNRIPLPPTPADRPPTPPPRSEVNIPPRLPPRAESAPYLQLGKTDTPPNAAPKRYHQTYLEPALPTGPSRVGPVSRERIIDRAPTLPPRSRNSQP